MVGWLAGEREGDIRAFSFLLTREQKPLSKMFMVAIIIKDSYKIGNYNLKTQINNNMF